MWFRLVVFFGCALIGFGACAQSEEQRQRVAIERLFEALRTMAVVEHLILPTQLRNQAVESWGFQPLTLGVDEVLAMEERVDRRALREEIVEAHMAYLSAAQALEAAQFFESVTRLETVPYQRLGMTIYAPEIYLGTGFKGLQ